MTKALIVIDVQNGFITKSSSHIVARIKELLESKKFNTVVFTQFVNVPNSPFRKIKKWNKVGMSPETDIANVLKPFAKTVFKKNLYSSFTAEFEQFLKEKRITQLYLVGIDTECCVLKTAVDAFEKGYEPFLLENYCASHESRKFHSIGVALFGRLVSPRHIIKGRFK